MNHGLQYAATKFAVAVSEMARSDASLRQRVLDAATEFNPVGAEDLPAPIAVRYRELHARLTCLGELGTERALCSFSDREVRRLASLIVDLKIEIAEAAAEDAR